MRSIPPGAGEHQAKAQTSKAGNVNLDIVVCHHWNQQLCNRENRSVTIWVSRPPSLLHPRFASPSGAMNKYCRQRVCLQHVQAVICVQ